MIVSNCVGRLNSLWLPICMLLSALFVLPLGIASAQDYGAVAKRLKKSVLNGEITAKQAQAMLAVLKKTAGPKAGGNKKVQYQNALIRKIQAAVKAGKLTEKQAKAKLVALKKTSNAKKYVKKGTGKKGTGKKTLKKRIYAKKLLKKSVNKKKTLTKRAYKSKKTLENRIQALERDLKLVLKLLQGKSKK